ncbi:hypothetical protein [uncultured Desulfovibrio sp.]|uniref:hypothetical protein n=1 Tax=uncultured Desulfovibrio sp. TaxID=167968 RepID=UPI002625B2A6|nr:hypothetical protein [uncultured Desulfovibrio sp.]
MEARSIRRYSFNEHGPSRSGTRLGRKRQHFTALEQGFLVAPPGIFPGAGRSGRAGPSHQHTTTMPQFQQPGQAARELREAARRIMQRTGKTYQLVHIRKIKTAADKAFYWRG